MSDQNRVAVFVDAENLTQWIKNGGLETLLEDLTSVGTVVVRKAYANWTTTGVAAHQGTLNRLGFELIHTYHPVSGKNSADIQITVDVMEYAWRDDLECIALATGDSDFSPLFRRLREMGKQVVGVGPRSALSESVKSSCSRFLYTHTETASPTIDEASRASAFDDAADLLETTMRTFDGPANCATLKNRMLNIDSAFDEKALGFKSFSDFVKAMDGVVLIQDGGAWYACFEDALPPAVQQESSDTTIPNKIADADVTEQYRRILRQKHWRAVPVSVLTECFRRMHDIEPLPRSEIPEAAVMLCDGNITTTDVRKAMNMLFKAGLMLTTETNESGENVWKVAQVAEGDMLDAVDTAMLVRLLAALDEADLPADTEKLRQLLLAEREKEADDDLIQAARKLCRSGKGQEP